MKRLTTLLALSFLMVGSIRATALQSEVLRIRNEIASGKMDAVAQNTEAMLWSIVKVANANLKAKGRVDLATKYEYEWNNKYKGMLVNRAKLHFIYGDIGDHHPLVQWLADFYNTVEATLGIEVCKMLHISDIKSVNFSIPVVFRPCTFPMDAVTISRIYEYKNHFAEGAVYYGLVPVVTWWAVSIGCWSGTAGVGSFLCGIAATGAEWTMGKIVAPNLSNFVFRSACSDSN